MSSRVTPLVWVMLIGTALAGVAGLSPGEAHGEDTADLILRHGVFYPVQPSGRVEGSLAVRGGRIAYLGPDAGADRLRGPKTRVIDLAGRAVTPGLIDAHSHLVGLGQALQEVDLTGTATYKEIVRKVREAASKVPAGTWVRGRGWDQNDWPEKQFPTHEELSAAVPDHPVWLTRVDGHAALVNARAMQVLGIDASIKDPSGGRFLRGGDGRPTGVLIDNAMGVVEGRMPDASVEDRQRALRLAARHCVELGLTTVTDMGIGDADYRAYSALRKAGELPLRAALFLTDDARLLTHWFERGPEIDPGARLLVRGVKMYIDGALGSRGAALVEPYSDDPGNLGLLVSTGDHLEDVSRRALAAGFQVGIHAIGDRGGLVVLDAMERAFGGPKPEARFRVEHAQVMRPEDLQRMSRLGVIASMQPTHATSDMPWAGDRVGERRLAGAYAWRKVLNAGGRLALGSDFPVESADPRLGLYAAVTRQDLQGKPPGGWLPGERLTREEALRGFTLDAAWSLFLEKEVGSLEVGKRADLVVFARDPMTVPEAEIPKAEIDFTIVEGQVVHERGRTR
jgi:predicted amidohydrolase YtcJ